MKQGRSKVWDGREETRSTWQVGRASGVVRLKRQKSEKERRGLLHRQHWPCRPVSKYPLNIRWMNNSGLMIFLLFLSWLPSLPSTVLSFCIREYIHILWNWLEAWVGWGWVRGRHFGLNAASSQNSYTEILIQDVTVSGGGDVGLWEATVLVGSSWQDQCPYKERER